MAAAHMEGRGVDDPRVLAAMPQALDLKGHEQVLKIGTGSGYQAAVLPPLAKQVYIIEILVPLAQEARERLAALGYANVEVKAGDGWQGWPPFRPSWSPPPRPRFPLAC